MSQAFAGIFAFRGVTFLLGLQPEGAENLRGSFWKGEDLGRASLLFQTLNLNVKVAKYLSQVLEVQRR